MQKQMDRFQHGYAVLVLAVLVLCSTIAISGENQRAVSSSGMLRWLGHASVKIKTGHGEVIYIDPYTGSDYTDSADIVLITHQHSDHNQLSLVRRKNSCTVISNVEAIRNSVYQSFTIGSITIQSVAAYNDYHDKSASVGFIVEFDSIKIYHAGDTGKIPEMADLAAQHITYALLPIDGTYTMTPAEAVAADAMIQPKVAIPIHDLGTDRSLFNATNKMIMNPGESIELTTPTALGPETMMLLPEKVQLYQNFPNPFNPNTVISYRLQVSCVVHIGVFDALGRNMETLVNEKKPSGVHQVRWNASHLPSGVYFIKLQTGGLSIFKKAVLLR